MPDPSTPYRPPSADWRAQQLADDLALFAAIRRFLAEPVVAGRLLRREASE